MSFFKKIFGHDERSTLLEGIEFNTKQIAYREGRSKLDSEYLAICTLLDDLRTRERGQKGITLVMDILRNEYSTHQSDVLIYLTWQSGKRSSKDDAERAIRKRHDVSEPTISKNEAVKLLITNISNNAINQFPHFYNDMKTTFGDKFIIENEKTVLIEVVTAILAYELQVISNLECKENSGPISREVLGQLFLAYGENSLSLFSFYENAYRIGREKGLLALKSNANNEAFAQMVETEEGIDGSFIRSMLGKNIKSFIETHEGGKKINLYLSMGTSSFLVGLLGTWKNIRTRHSRIDFS